jgi:hypothetical protein
MTLRLRELSEDEWVADRALPHAGGWGGPTGAVSKEDLPEYVREARRRMAAPSTVSNSGRPPPVESIGDSIPDVCERLPIGARQWCPVARTPMGIPVGAMDAARSCRPIGQPPACSSFPNRTAMRSARFNVPSVFQRRHQYSQPQVPRQSRCPAARRQQPTLEHDRAPEHRGSVVQATGAAFQLYLWLFPGLRPRCAPARVPVP